MVNLRPVVMVWIPFLLCPNGCGDETTVAVDGDECQVGDDCPDPGSCATVRCQGDPRRCVVEVDCECACAGHCGLLDPSGCDCGDCGCGQECIGQACVFTACQGRQCGDDGCGGSCGDCGETDLCEEGRCVPGPIWIVRPDSTGACNADDRYCSSIQQAIDVAADGAIIRVGTGSYSEPFYVQDRTGLTIEGAGADQVTIRPTSTVSWALPGYPEYDGRQVAIRIVDSTDILLSGLTFDFGLIKDNLVSGILFWNSTGTLYRNTIGNMNVPDREGGYHDITTYIRAPDFTPDQRAQVVVAGNTFRDTGRLGVVAHDFVHALILGNLFEKTEADFGYAIEIGSTATGRITGNRIRGFDTPAASDDSASAGILVENCFGTGLADIVKPVWIDHNEVLENQYGIMIGNAYDGLGTDVDIQIHLEENHVHDNIDGGVLVVDEDRSLGSSVSFTSQGNQILDNGGAGYFFYTLGDGQIEAVVAGDVIVGNQLGLAVEQYDEAQIENSLYDIVIHHNVITDNHGQGLHSNVFRGVHERNNWWGCNAGPIEGTGSCDTILGPLEPGPHLVLSLVASPDTIHVGETSQIAADLRFDCHGEPTSSLGCICNRLPILLETDLGNFDGSSTTQACTCRGVAQATLSSGDAPGMAEVTATVHHQTVTTQVAIVGP